MGEMIQVTMLLANAPAQREGSADDRLTLNLALTPHGEIDPAAYGADPAPWVATRLTPDGRVHHGELVRFDKGWALQGEDGEDSPLWTLTANLFRPGEYVSVRTHRDEELTYRIVAVQDAPPLAVGTG
jgi:hypothetical protein